MNTAASLARICRRLRLSMPRHDHLLQFNRWWETLQRSDAAARNGRPPYLDGPAKARTIVSSGQTGSPVNYAGKGGNCARISIVWGEPCS